LPSAKSVVVSVPFVSSRAVSTRPAIPWHRLTLPRPPHPIPTFVTMANAPARGRDGEGYRSDLGKGGTEIFLQAGLDRKFTDLPGGRRANQRMDHLYALQPKLEGPVVEALFPLADRSNNVCCANQS
jgi:hypothetical protein